jgi:ATP-dependent Clp protease ATP-binding subunit ClpX
MYDLPSRDDISKCLITSDVVEKKTVPQLTTKEGQVIKSRKPKESA